MLAKRTKCNKAVEGDCEVFVFAKMTLSSIPVLQSAVWKTIKRFFLYITRSLSTGFSLRLYSKLLISKETFRHLQKLAKF